MEENEVEKSGQPQETNLPEPIETPKDPETEAFENDPRYKWYVVHVNSGHERKVAISLMERVENSQMKDKIIKVLVPTQNKIVVEAGRKKTVQERLFPGYVLVKMDLSDISWHLVRNTTGVTGFVGTGGKPTPLPDQEVTTILKFSEMEAPKYEAKFHVGDSVRILNGPFVDFLGKVDSLDEEKGKVKVLVSIFGRETPVELDYLQVSPL
jgi:transcriptional antiterminator NusG